MTKTKKMTLVALMAAGAIGMTTIAGLSLNKSFRGLSAYAGTSAVTEAPEGSRDNPAPVKTGKNVITEMVVNDNKMLNYKELVYYMTFTPAQSGLYTFTHDNIDVGVGEIYSEDETTYGEWNDDFTVYSVELTADATYTVIVNNFDWMLDLTDYEDGAEYTLPVPATITVAYEGAAAGSSKDSALSYTVGDTMFVQGNSSVWYTFTPETSTEYYFIAFGGTAVAYIENRDGELVEKANVASNFEKFTVEDVAYVCVTPEAGNYTRVQVLEADKQTNGSCIATAEAIPANGVVGGGNWYKYTVGDSDVTVSLTPTDDAYEVVKEYKDAEGNVVFTDRYTVVGTVSVYVNCDLVTTLYDGASLTLEAGKTYYFFAPDDVYQDWDDDGNVTVEVAIQSKLVIG